MMSIFSGFFPQYAALITSLVAVALFIIKELIECKRRHDIKKRKIKAMQWFLVNKTITLLNQLKSLVEIAANASINLDKIKIDLIAKTYTLQYIKNCEVEFVIYLSNSFEAISDDIILEATHYSDKLPNDFMALNEGIYRVCGILAVTIKVIELHNKNMETIIKFLRGESFFESINVVREILLSLECIKKELKNFPEFIEVTELMQNLKK